MSVVIKNMPYVHELVLPDIFEIDQGVITDVGAMIAFDFGTGGTLKASDWNHDSASAIDQERVALEALHATMLSYESAYASNSTASLLQEWNNAIAAYESALATYKNNLYAIGGTETAKRIDALIALIAPAGVTAAGGANEGEGFTKAYLDDASASQLFDYVESGISGTSLTDSTSATFDSVALSRTNNTTVTPGADMTLKTYTQANLIRTDGANPWRINSEKFAEALRELFTARLTTMKSLLADGTDATPASPDLMSGAQKNADKNFILNTEIGVGDKFVVKFCLNVRQGDTSTSLADKKCFVIEAMVVA